MKIKEFYKKHEVEIIVGTLTGGIIITTILATKYLGIKNAEAKKIIKSVGSREVIGRTTEEVIDFVLNASENDKFAIFKESSLYEIIEL